MILLRILIIFILSLKPLEIHCLPSQIKIGVLLNEDQHEQDVIFNWSIDRANQRGLLSRSKMVGITRRIIEGDSWDAEKKACELLRLGAITIIGPTNPQTRQHVGSICDTLDVPLMNIVPKGVSFNSLSLSTSLIHKAAYPTISPIEHQSTISIDMSISRKVLIEAYLDIAQALKWKKFVYLYDNEESLYHLQEHFNGKNLKSNEYNVKILRFDPTKPYRNAFWYLKSTKMHYFMLDVHCSNLKTVMKHAQQVSIVTETNSFLTVCLDTQTMDLDDFKYSRSRIIWLSALDNNSVELNSFVNHVNQYGGSKFLNPGFVLSPNKVKTESALIHDAIEALAYALPAVDSSEYLDHFNPVSCNSSIAWRYGSTVVNFMKTSVELEGMTGLIKFDADGERTDYRLNIVRLKEKGPEIIGNWTQNRAPRVQLETNEQQYLQLGDPSLYEHEERETLVVTSIKSDPHFMYKQTTKSETGNARYEGYAIDLIDELSRIVGFDYVFKEVDDGKYGKYDEERKVWNGMIHEVMSGKADLAIADLSITSNREEAVEFTLPYMSTGISILFKKPTTKELELFSFLSPFENHVWVYVCGAYVGVSSLLFVVGRISPYEWADPHPCRQEDKILRNQFSVSNSFWFTIAAVMQQGSDLAPRSLSTRLVAAIWYFFTLIMISSYTANLAAFLTVEKVVYPIEKAEDLYRHPQNLRYGCVESGSTDTFFQKSKNDSTFKKMHDEMVLMGSSDKGVAEVEKGDYAFFMESVSIEYTIERNCNLTQIGGLLDSKGYGIALAKNSTRRRDYRTRLSEAILTLQESGMLEVLKNRWWKEKRGGGACDIDDSQGGEGVKELTLANVGGVFVVLGMGIATSFLLCGLELYAKSHRLASSQGTSKVEQLKRRIRFALSLSENY